MSRTRSSALSVLILAVVAFCLIHQSFVAPREMPSTRLTAGTETNERGSAVSMQNYGGGRWNQNKFAGGRFAPSGNPQQYQREGAAVFVMCGMIVFFCFGLIGN